MSQAINKSNQAPSIKICGLRDETTIAAMNGLPITEVGLVFAQSKRQVTVKQGARLVDAIKKLVCRNGLAPRAAGVFVNLPLQDMIELLEQVQLDIVQLHGHEAVDYYRSLKQAYPQLVFWKVVSIKAETAQPDKQQIMNELEPFIPYIELILLDAPGGGTGMPFNWQAISIYKEAAQQLGKALVVAGGLQAGNVGELLGRYSVDGVDVSSGVETDDVKDIEKITEFVRKVIEA